MTTKGNFVTPDTYHEHMYEALSALRAAFDLITAVEERGVTAAEKNRLLAEAGVKGRYAFLVGGTNALEAAANALLRGLGMNQQLYEDIERLPTLPKCELFCLVKGHKLDRGNDLYRGVVDIVKARNAFVHPKPKDWAETMSKNMLHKKRMKFLPYPKTFATLVPQHASQALRDIFAFLSWVLFDICQLTIEEGSQRIGYGSLFSGAEVVFAAQELRFDIRTFGKAAMLAAKPSL